MTPRVLIAGGGVAGLETLLALQALAQDRVRIELLAPERHFTYRPLAVTEPFGGARVQRFPLEAIGADRGVEIHRDALARVLPDDRVVETQGGRRLAYDTLVLALGARPVEALPGALTFRGPQDTARMQEIVARLQEGTIERLAFVVPSGTTWALPLYELALQTAAVLGAVGITRKLSLVTPERSPLAAFGREAGSAVKSLLAEAGVVLRTESIAEEVADGRLWMGLEGSFPVDAAVALPRLVGPRPRGVPCDPLGFVAVDELTRALGLEGVHAVGDVAAHGAKQGGLSAQQADVAAAVIAAAAGAPVTPSPYRPVLRGLLLAGTRTRYLRHEPGGESEVSRELLWWPPTKIAGRYLSPYLAAHLDIAPAPEASGAIPVRSAAGSGVTAPLR